MRSVWVKLFCTAAVLAAYFFGSAFLEAKRVNRIQVRSVDVGQVVDGAYQGGFVYQNQVVQVTVTTKGHEITDMQVVENLRGDIYTKAAQSVVSQVLQAQRVDIPADANDAFLIQADKKALLLAAQGALSGTPIPSSKERSPVPAEAILFLLSFYAGCFSLGTQWAGYIAFRLGRLNTAARWVVLEDIAFLAMGGCCGLAILLTMISN